MKRDARVGSMREGATRWLWRARRAAAGAVLTGVLSVSLVACGPGSAGKLSLSVSSGPPGTVVGVTGNAGPDCLVDKNWFGFDFERYGDPTSGPVTEMTTLVAPNGSWSASFTVPSYLGGSASRGPGAPATPGRYQFAAPTCQSQVVDKASFRLTTGAPSASISNDYVGMAVTTTGLGYWLVQADGGVAAFGDARSYGSLQADKTPPAAPIVGIARTYDAKGYWLASANGHVYSFGDARSYGSLPTSQTLSAPITGFASTPDGHGYWLAAADGRVHNFGDAPFDGSPPDDLAPYDALGARPAGGYVVTAANDAGTYAYPGGALSAGGTGTALSATLVGTAVDHSGNGTWQVGSDGGVTTTGDATFYGSVTSDNGVLSGPITGIAATPDGNGYWMVDADGSVYIFGDALFEGSAAHPAQ